MQCVHAAAQGRSDATDLVASASGSGPSTAAMKLCLLGSARCWCACVPGARGKVIQAVRSQHGPLSSIGGIAPEKDDCPRASRAHPSCYDRRGWKESSKSQQHLSIAGWSHKRRLLRQPTTQSLRRRRRDISEQFSALDSAVVVGPR